MISEDENQSLHTHNVSLIELRAFGQALTENRVLLREYVIRESFIAFGSDSVLKGSSPVSTPIISRSAGTGIPERLLRYATEERALGELVRAQSWGVMSQQGLWVPSDSSYMLGHDLGEFGNALPP